MDKEQADKTISVALDLANEKQAITEQQKLQASTLWQLKVRGWTEPMILEELKISRREYHDLVDLCLKGHRPTETDINLQRDLAVERHLKIMREFEEMADNAENDAAKSYALRDFRQSVKDLGDIFSIKMPEKQEVDVKVNHTADATALELINALTKAKTQPAIEAEVVEDE